MQFNECELLQLNVIGYSRAEGRRQFPAIQDSDDRRYRPKSFRGSVGQEHAFSRKKKPIAAGEGIELHGNATVRLFYPM